MLKVLSIKSRLQFVKSHSSFIGEVINHGAYYYEN